MTEQQRISLIQSHGELERARTLVHDHLRVSIKDRKPAIKPSTLSEVDNIIRHAIDAIEVVVRPLPDEDASDGEPPFDPPYYTTTPKGTKLRHWPMTVFAQAGGQIDFAFPDSTGNQTIRTNLHGLMIALRLDKEERGAVIACLNSRHMPPDLT